MKKNLIFAAAVLFLPVVAWAQDTTGVAEVVPLDTTFGVDPTYLAMAVAFIVLHVNAVKGFFPSIATKPAGRLLAGAFSGLYLLVVQFPEFGGLYMQIMGPFVAATGAWTTVGTLLRKVGNGK